jgi:hypothetical protein
MSRLLTLFTELFGDPKIDVIYNVVSVYNRYSSDLLIVSV